MKRPTPVYVLIIRATHSTNAVSQTAALRELYHRGYWLGDGSNGDDQVGMAMRARGYVVRGEEGRYYAERPDGTALPDQGGFPSHMTLREARMTCLADMGYGPSPSETEQ